MGTRADFYVGRGEMANWLGSIAWDGYPGGIDKVVLRAKNTSDFVAAVGKFFTGRTDVTLPENGWPWPWEESCTTDYAYALDDGCVWASCFGSPWWKATRKQPDEPKGTALGAMFPNMKSRQNVTMGPRSGVLVFGASGVLRLP